jgi:hypothetical protein
MLMGYAPLHPSYMPNLLVGWVKPIVNPFRQFTRGMGETHRHCLF